MKIALIGAPNVGKSTLFNRLVGRRVALTHSQPGMTRDRLEGKTSIYDLEFDLVDTAGIDTCSPSDLAKEMNEQSFKAIQLSDMIFFMVDENMAVNKDLANFIRRSLKKTCQKPVTVLVNKIDRNKGEWPDFLCLGFGEPVYISAEHNLGIPDLYHRISSVYSRRLFSSKETCDQNKTTKIAFVGRPNAGKSSLINAIIGDYRLIASQKAGTTHDAVEVDWLYKERRFVLIDTAGQRKRSKVVENQEFLYVNSAVKTSASADVFVLVVDALCPLEKQDLTIAEQATKKGKPVIVAINKWDLVKNPLAAMDDIKYQVSHTLPIIGDASIVPVSATRSHNLNKLIDVCISVYNRMGAKIETSRLNKWLKRAMEEKSPPLFKGKEVKIKYIVQVSVNPLRFVLFTNTQTLLKSYERYLLNNLRDAFSLWGGPIAFQYRKEDNPYKKHESSQS
ncbi:MAG: ribosome biogenesis GTPase Der [Holosporales bacterium]|jgi:GTP-binding protein|nr:ribosome biogenesis GTPase Der [Holosporales bacterium]